MNFKHGSLESIILNVLWELESKGIYKNSVKDVYEYISLYRPEKKAYTTVKTVMDRLYNKEILLRIKQGKKFFYRTAYSNADIVANALKIIAFQYCNDDMNRLINIAQSVKLSNEKIETKINIG